MNDNQLNNEKKLEAQAKQITSLLETQSNRLSMRTLKQLENARSQAVSAHAQELSSATVNRDGSLSWFSWAEHHRTATVALLMGAILVGFTWMQMMNQNAENSDAFLLGADLPPEAFVDRGFEPSLNNQHAKL